MSISQRYDAIPRHTTATTFTMRQTVAAAALRLCNTAMRTVRCSEDGSDSPPTLAKRRVGFGVACTHPSILLTTAPHLHLFLAGTCLDW
jgi:hypothetical protein